MPPLFNILFPSVMLIIALLSVAIVYVVWLSVDSEEFARLDSVDSQADPFAQLYPEPTPAKSIPASPLAEKKPEPVPEPTTPAPAPAVPSVPAAGTVEVLRLLRDTSDGTLIVEVDGQRYRDADALASDQSEERFLVTVQDLAEFARLEQADIPELTLEELLPPSLPQAGAAPPPHLETVTLEDGEGVIPWEAMSIAEQIDLILQERLSRNPNYANRSVRIRQSPQGGIRIEADGKTFDAVGDVTDEEVKQIIQEAIQAWEARA